MEGQKQEIEGLEEVTWGEENGETWKKERDKKKVIKQ